MTRPLGAVQNRDYDALNRLVRVSDALNQQTQFQYDANDNLLVQTMP
ncbi:RHS repeat protein, partial [Pseudoteredinibacter isoporae]|nr:RHS repeat protein [Pseudoteredinibacter isoporae]